MDLEPVLAGSKLGHPQRSRCKILTHIVIVLSLAYAEMRTILAKLLWNFDTALLPQPRQWDNTRSYIVWEKHALWVRLQERSNRGVGI